MILPILAELGGSIHVGLAAMGVGIGIGLTGLGMTTAVGRNPGAFTQVLVHGILAIAFDRGDRFLRAVSRSLIFTGKAIDVAPEI
jgi:ATP synthase subunit C.